MISNGVNTPFQKFNLGAMAAQKRLKARQNHEPPRRKKNEGVGFRLAFSSLVPLVPLVVQMVLLFGFFGNL